MIGDKRLFCAKVLNDEKHTELLMASRDAHRKFSPSFFFI